MLHRSDSQMQEAASIVEAAIDTASGRAFSNAAGQQGTARRQPVTMLCLHVTHSVNSGTGCQSVVYNTIAVGESDNVKAAHLFLQRTLYKINRMVLFW